ncbi:hypothetical protein cypCar_00043659 [Cyprinus carpio]|nr:hypothetical protein cypCar_00043659 [Cyprinus carpio]
MLLTIFHRDVIDSVGNSTAFFTVFASAVYNGVDRDQPAAPARADKRSAQPELVARIRSAFGMFFLLIWLVENGHPQKTVVIRFHEHEASVPGILAKVQDAIGSEDGMILTDGQGNEILDTEGTKGSAY